MIPRRRAWVVIGVVLASFLPAPEAVAGEEDWSQREILTRPGVNGNAPRLFAAADGALTAAWVATSASSLDWALVIRTRPAGGTWSIEQVIEADVSRYDIELAVDSRLVAAYLPDDGAGPHVRTQEADGTFGPSMLLAPGLPGRVLSGPKLVVSKSGRQVVVWLQRLPGAGNRVVAVRRDGSSAAWSKPKFLTGKDARPLSIATGAARDGSVAVLWTDVMWEDGLRSFRVKHRLLSAHGEWMATEFVMQSAGVADLQVANRGSGRVTAIWVETDELEHHAYTSSRTASGRWTPAGSIAAQPDRDELWQTLTTNGRLTAVVWSSLPSSDGDSWLMARVQDGRAWGPPRRIGRASSRMWFNAAAFERDGALRVVWIRKQGEMRTRVRGRGGAWGPPTHITYVGLDDYRPVVVAYGDREAAVVSATRNRRIAFAELSQ
ncbi:hypothetical protein GCM10011376_26240 [Nocardioides flavus (ex Wang et al. 2016)]|uniref:BNR repeat-containing family member n=1 Tax=Nocardioides flavus (ex Wang et al. 2016) TaxID=2058780 RepID=A0ABQ3HPH1_9ACTN|nr:MULTISPECIES: hypothetical protein [Nocardioides]GHE18014.1 hypothetical protein GCM10011376_26240 [Nocardioides flavus (ex Wang et al. 2016)]